MLRCQSIVNIKSNQVPLKAVDDSLAKVMIVV
jgi:hypothetical protein